MLTRSRVRWASAILRTMIPRVPEPERGFVLAVLAQGVDPEEELAEVNELARTAGVEPIGAVVQHRARPAQRTYVGKGKLEELKESFKESGAESVIVDGELDPSQQRYLENALNTRVVDRTQLILDIFAQHATSAEGKLQVELAQLDYNLPRMRGMWQHLERLGGGVGTRGPGESQLESDRRMARQRINQLRRKLKDLGKQRATRRKERTRSQTPTVALAGYTNVGKSTLLNALTGSDVSVEDQLFHTLGFIRRLPTQLVEGFASTLEETLSADIVLHVVDASAEDDEQDRQREAVDDVLHEIGAADLPVEVVLNKIDRADPLHRRRLANRFPTAPQVSALTGEGMEELKAEIARRFEDRWERVRMLVPYEDGAKLSELYALGTPIEEREDTPAGVLLIARLPRRELTRFAPYLVADSSSGRSDRDHRESA